MAAVSILVTTPTMRRISEGCAALGDCIPWPADQSLFEALAGHPPPRAMAASNRPIDAAVLDQLPRLEIIANMGVGYDDVDVAAASARNIVVCNTPDVLTEDVADFTLGLLLMTVRQMGAAERFLRAGQWGRALFPLSPSLQGRSIGILGMGRIGRAVGRRLAGFDAPISYFGRRQQTNLPYAYFDDAVALAEAVDTLICILPGGAATRHIIDARLLEALGPKGVVVNVGRGSCLDEAALVAALGSGAIAGAGLDVFEHEPHPSPELLTFDNVVLTPHAASATRHTRNAMAQLVIDNIASWLRDRRALTPVCVA
jgi:lactate dehydrogenase-like 2-hydroxyacid dehydrogenase